MTLRLVRYRGEPYLWALIVGAALGVLSLVSPLIAVGLIAGVVFAALAFARPVMLCYVLVAAVVFLSGMPRGGLVPLFIPNEPLLAAAAGFTFVVLLLRRDGRRLPNAVIAALLFMILGTAIIPVLMYYVRDFPLSTSDIFSLVAPAQYALIVWIFASLPRDDDDRYRIVHFMLICGSIVAAIGLLEAIRVPFVVSLIRDFYPNVHFNTAAELGRITSIMGAWNSLGNFLMINLIMVLALHGYPSRGKWGSINLIVNLILCGAALLASGSYASLGGLALSLVLVKTFDRRGWQIIFLLLLGMGLMGVFLQDLIVERLNYQFGSGSLVPQTLEYRFKVWNEIYLPLIAKSPLWGITPTFAGRITWAWAESQYFYLLVRSGLVSLIAHLAYVGILAAWAFKRFRTAFGSDMTRPLGIALFALLTVLSLMGITNEVFTNSGAVDYMWMLVGLIAAGASTGTVNAAQGRLL